MTRLEALRNIDNHQHQNQQMQDVAQIKINPPIIAESIDDTISDALSALWNAQQALDTVQRKAQAERRRIAAILATFAASPISASSLQPILDLAAEMNQEAK